MTKTGKLGEEYSAMVGFIDLLGFGAKSKIVETHEQLEDLRKQIKFVHDAFQVNRKQQFLEFQLASRQEILAFSDCIVISVAELSKMTEQIGVFRRFLIEALQWGLAQFTCMMEGIFLRGGISFGPWFYQDNILISPAHTKAYYLESNVARYPVICFDGELYNKLKKSWEEEPSYSRLANLFRKYSPDGEKEFHHLDYLKIGLDTLPGEIPSFPDGSEWGKKLQNNARTVIEKRVFLKHKEAVIRGCMTAPKNCRDKFIFLMKYHNELVDSYKEKFQECRIPIPPEL